MKKFLVMLMVVAMASFLFVGCFGTTPPIDPDEPVEPVVPLPPSITPVIEKITNNPDDEDDLANVINLYSSDPQYMNKTEVENGILVKGFALRYSEVKVYVGGVVVGTSTTYGVLERFTVFVAKASLGDDGAKTLYATATEMGLAESAPSTVYAFTLDVVAPKMVTVAADLDEETVTVTFDEAVDEDTAEENESYIVYNITRHWEVYTRDAELISPKVVELEAYYWFADEGETIRVTCEIIEDLAGNEATDLFGYCYAEGGPVPEPEPDLPVMGGTVTIDGIVKYNELLTADISGIGYTPYTGDDEPTYQWKRGGAVISGETGSTYLLILGDIGKVITVTVTADGVHATGSVTSAPTAAVDKADGPTAPAAPVEEVTTSDSITLEAVAGNEFSIVGGEWQDEVLFAGLDPITPYTFIARVKETPTHYASDPSGETIITTLAAG